MPAGEIALNVTNHNYLDVVIYVLHDGQQTRVGTVTGSSSALLIGSDAFARTQALILQPGQYIEWTLETDLRRSSVGAF